MRGDSDEGEKKSLEKLIIDLFINNNYGRCLLSRQVFEAGFDIRSDTERKSLTRKLNWFERKGILAKVIAKDRGVFYVLSAIAEKFPKAVTMTRQAESLGDVAAVMISDGLPGVPLIYLRQVAPSKVKKLGRPTTFSPD